MTKEGARATAEESGIPLEHDKRCMCTDPTLHRLKWTNWKLVQAEQALKELADAVAQAVRAERERICKKADGWGSPMTTFAEMVRYEAAGDQQPPPPRRPQEV